MVARDPFDFNLGFEQEFQVARKMEYTDGDSIGTQRGTTGTSMALNNQKGQGGQKPSETAGNSNPGNTKPRMEPEGPVPMPK